MRSHHPCSGFVLAAFLAGTIATARGKHGREAYRRLEGKLPRDLGAGAGSNGNHSPGVHFLNFPDKEINELGARGIVSFAGEENRADVNAMTLQSFLNYNLPKGWYLTTSPLITANWEADDRRRDCPLMPIANIPVNQS
jgi:hypothetical protein